MENLEKVAVLIDADNASYQRLELIFQELSTYGRIVIKKAYGNWKKPTLANWEREVKRLAIKTEQQFDFVAGKNTTDIAMVIDAMDLLHTNTYDAFALVSSDSDFAPLAIRLRQSGSFVIGVGENKTPEAFRNACDEFILTEYLAPEEAAPEEAAPAKVAPAEAVPAEAVPAEAAPAESFDKTDVEEIYKLLKIASDRYQDADGFVNVSSAGTYIKRVKPDFSPLTYGFSKLPEFLRAFPDKYEVKKYKGKGSVNIIAYRCL